jgi:hypothetical protein
MFNLLATEAQIEAKFGQLPMPNGPAPRGEEQRERAVERLVDSADRVFLAGRATQAQYDAWNRALDKWAAL